MKSAVMHPPGLQSIHFPSFLRFDFIDSRQGEILQLHLFPDFLGVGCTFLKFSSCTLNKSQLQEILRSTSTCLQLPVRFPYPPTVLIIGGGIAGPVMALLHKKGYKPVVIEKLEESLSLGGASYTLLPNGFVIIFLSVSSDAFPRLKVLSLINVLDSVQALRAPIENFRDIDADDHVIGQINVAKEWVSRYGQKGWESPKEN